MNVPRDVGGTADAIPRWRGVPAVGGLIALVVLAYGPAYGSGFIWDDDAYVTTNLTLRSLAGLWKIWFEPGAVPQYYPLVHTTFWIEHHLWGSNAAGYHVINVLLHALAAVLLYRVLSRLRLPGAWLVAAVFALHPVQVESVSWITERKNVLSGLLYMASLLAWLRWDPALNGNGRSRGYFGSLAFYLGALLSKTVTASLPAVILLLHWWKTGRIERRAVRAVVPFFGVGLLMSAVTIVMEKHTVGAQGADWDLSFLQRLLIAGRALWFYLGKLVWPSNLTFIYPRWEPSGFGAAMALYLLAAVLVVVALFLARRRIGRGPLAALLFFGGTLFPALGFIDVYPMRYSFVADHFQYLACLGPMVLGVAAAVLLAPASWRARPIVGTVVAVVLVLGLGMTTWKRAEAFRSLESLWTDTLRKNPSAWMAHHNLAMLREEQGRFEEAAREYQAALALRPDLDQSHYNLGNVWVQFQRWTDAEREYREALALNPGLVPVHTNLGNVLYKTGRVDEAIEHWQQSLEAEPGNHDLRRSLEHALEQTGRDGEAAQELEVLVAQQPDDSRLLQKLAWMRATSPRVEVRDGRHALELSERLIRTTREPHPVILDTYAAALAEIGQFAAASAALERALALIGTTPYDRTDEIRARLALYEEGVPFRDHERIDTAESVAR
ncbi:MAG: tetratricopeptide repeat protein [Candidatus Eisenbacteria bacterium]|uniref:Tetratricopeptide repeat protein n=1 Tax=Eiseniibacteriota bacterium TaxID=2212470 RepID=A0A956LYP9_UNCEI|nr:tetratricopeptide repeat protein [Candidatus Eisenbacteria bacterium]